MLNMSGFVIKRNQNQYLDDNIICLTMCSALKSWTCYCCRLLYLKWLHNNINSQSTYIYLLIQFLSLDSRISKSSIAGRSEVASMLPCIYCGGGGMRWLQKVHAFKWLREKENHFPPWEERFKIFCIQELVPIDWMGLWTVSINFIPDHDITWRCPITHIWYTAEELWFILGTIFPLFLSKQTSFSFLCPEVLHC